MKLFDLSGKTAIVTGGNGGIGYGIAVGLAEAGANLVIAGRNEAKNQSALDSLGEAGYPCIAIKCDVNDTADINACVDAAVDEFDGLHILVNNAGISGGGAPEQIEEEVWDAVLHTNLKSVMRFSQAVYPHLKQSGGGKIINIGSMYSLFGSSLVSPYSASKGGVIQLTKSLAIAWAKDRIQVNAILPGWITTEMTAPVADNKPFYDLILARTAQGRFGEPSEMAGAGVFLASSASDFVTGISLPVDGGYSIT